MTDIGYTSNISNNKLVRSFVFGFEYMPKFLKMLMNASNLFLHLLVYTQHKHHRNRLKVIQLIIPCKVSTNFENFM